MRSGHCDFQNNTLPDQTLLLRLPLTVTFVMQIIHIFINIMCLLKRLIITTADYDHEVIAL